MLAVAAFGIGTAEFIPTGLLPAITGDLGVSLAQGGHLVVAYAAGVVIGGPLLTVAAGRWPRKVLLLTLLGLFIVGSLLTAAASTFPLAIAARFVTGFPHGAFFGTGATVATGLAGPGRGAAAVARMLGGLATANILGVPGAVLIAGIWGWRWSFVAVAGLGLVALLALALRMPRQPPARADRVRTEFRALAAPRVVVALAVVMFGFAGVFACMSYVAPLLVRGAGFAAGALPVLLVLIGVGMTAGNYLGGALATRAAAVWVVAGLLAALMLFLVLIPVVSTSQPGVLLAVLGVAVAGFAISPVMQARIIELAHEAPSLSSATAQSAFNIANSLGAWVGTLTLSAGLGLGAPSAAGAGLSLIGLLLVGVVIRRWHTPRASSEA